MIVGQELGDWKCVQIIGKGNFGTVALWANYINGQSTAVKKFDLSSSNNDNEAYVSQMKERWRKEVDLMYNQIECDAIVSTFPVPKALLPLSPSPLLCMEHCENGDLRKMLRQSSNISGLSESELRNVLKCIGEAIRYLHSINIVHRDIKPENILVKSREGKKVYKLSDLGLAKDLAHNEALCSTQVGTLHYLAPEVYMGKSYDKTVDFWSFGVIAFELSCGFRPFLHDEPPTNWISYAEHKMKDIIAIYRTEEGSVNFSKRIPFNTHLTERFKQCFETWLCMMLQFEPNRRGKKIFVSQEGASLAKSKLEENKEFEQIVGLTVLSTILNMKMLYVSCPAQSHAFAIGRSTLIKDVQNWIDRDIGLKAENQLIVTNKGSLVLSSDNAMNFFKKSDDISDLFMIPKTHLALTQILKLKLPKTISKFLQSWNSIKDSKSMRKFWVGAINFAKTENTEFLTLVNAMRALKQLHKRKYVVEITALKKEISHLLLVLGEQVKFEAQLELIEKRFIDPIKESEANFSINMEDLNKEFATSIENWTEKLKINSKSYITEINLTYNKYLTLYETWVGKSSDANIMKELSKIISNYLARRDPLLEELIKNFGAILRQVTYDEEVELNLREMLDKLHANSERIIKTRVQKQLELLEKAYPSKDPTLISSGNLLSESTTLSSNVPVTTPESHKNNLSDSLEKLSHSQGHLSPEINDMMQKVSSLEFETEKELENALARAQEVSMRHKKIDWKFLDDL